MSEASKAAGKILALVLPFCHAWPAWGAEPPANDVCDAATPVAEGTHRGTLVLATNDGSSTLGQPAQPDVWYRFTTAQPGRLILSTCGTHNLPGPEAGLDTVLSAHWACPGNARNEIAANDDWSAGESECTGNEDGSSRDSAITIDLDASRTVHIRVTRYNENSAGEFILRVHFEGNGAPTNDGCLDALAVNEGVIGFSTVGATTDGPDEPGVCDFSSTSQIDADVWFCHVATCDAVVRLRLCGSNFDTKLAVYDGCECPPSGPPLACNDDAGAAPCDIQSELTFAVVEGASILIRVGGYRGAEGSGALQISCESEPQDSGGGGWAGRVSRIQRRVGRRESGAAYRFGSGGRRKHSGS